jgi:hypothetical protein
LGASGQVASNTEQIESVNSRYIVNQGNYTFFSSQIASLRMSSLRFFHGVFMTAGSIPHCDICASGKPDLPA